MVRIIRNPDLEQLYKNDAYTILGAGGELQEWFDGYQELLNEKEIGEILEWYVFTGKDLNRFIGTHEFKNDITILAFPIENLNIGKLSIFKLMMEDRWFCDVVDNARANIEEEDDD